MRPELTIAFRAYPGVSKRPVVHADDKLRLVELGLRSMRAALDGVRFRFVALLDRCPPEYESLVRDTMGAESVEIRALGGEGNFATFVRQIEVLSADSAAPHVYFAEDDYFYFPGSLAAGLDFARARPDADFVTLFDHPDLYGTALHAEPPRIVTHAGRHWRTSSSTCLSFLTSRAVLRRTAETLRTYGRGNHDASMWFALTKPRILRPVGAAAAVLRGDANRAIPARSWQYSWRQILAGRRYTLWSPMPTLATHLESSGLAPGFDWPQLLEDEARAIGQRSGESGR